MALSRFVLKTVPGVDRPAVVAALPTQTGQCFVLDLGANVDCSADQLVQFAAMGAVAAEVSGINRPKVALLNVGIEALKGTDEVRHAAAMLEAIKELNYVGFVEGNGVYRGDADVVVCDGFVGNVLLKSSEGLAAMMGKRLKNLAQSSVWARAVGFLAMPLLKRLQAELATEQHNGASLIGLQGIVVKSHGAADITAFKAAVKRAVIEVQADLPSRLHGRIEQYLNTDVTTQSS